MIGNRKTFHEVKSGACYPEEICGGDQSATQQRGGHHLRGQRKPSQRFGNNQISDREKVYFMFIPPDFTDLIQPLDDQILANWRNALGDGPLDTMEALPSYKTR